MAVASGAVHLDGLADTTDALLARDAAQAEIARKDPAIGSGGVVALVLVLAIQVAALASLAVLPGGSGPVVAGLACIAAGAVSRALPVVVVLLRGDAVGRVGLGAWFAERVGVLDGVSRRRLGCVVAVVTGLLAGADRVRCGDRGRCRRSASGSGSSSCARGGRSTGTSSARRSSSASRPSSARSPSGWR